MSIDRDQLASLVNAQEALLRDVGFDIGPLADAVDEYQWRHRAISQLLFPEGSSCYCPWATLYAWPGWVAKSAGDVEAALSRLRLPLANLLDPPSRGPKWRLVVHSRWQSSFLSTLNGDKLHILDTMLREELAVVGLELLSNRTKLEACACDGGGNVFEYKIQRKERNTEYKLRVFLRPKPRNTLLLLHGYDKGANDNKAHQAAQIQVACDRR